MPHRQLPLVRLTRKGAAALTVTAVVALSLFATGTAAHADTVPTGTLDQENDVFASHGFGSTTSTFAQTFTAGLAGPLSQVSLYLQSDSAVSVPFSITDVDGSSAPNGTVVGTGTFAASGSGWVTADLSAGTDVVAGKQYGITFPEPNAQVADVLLDESDTYSGGACYYNGQPIPYDMAFRTYVRGPATISGTPTTNVPVNHTYSYAYAVGNGGTAAVTAGVLPAGLNLSSEGVVSGTPTAIGTSNFTVTVTNSVGSTSTASIITTRATRAPGAPTAITAVADSSSADVSWTAPADSGDDAVTSYAVTASPGGAHVTTADTQATVPGLTPGTPHTFTVTATSESGTGDTSAPSNSVTPYTTPHAPTAFAVTPGDTVANLSWTAPAFDGGASISGYSITESANGGPYREVATPADDTTTAQITGLDDGNTYAFRIAAVNDAGTGPSASSPAVTPFRFASSPRDLTVTAGYSSVYVAWAAPASDGGSTVTGYDVQSSTGGTTWVDLGTVTGLAKTAVGLTNGTAYSFRVGAVNAAGTGPWSDVVIATPVTLASGPTDVSVVPGDETATVSWAVPNDDGGSPIIGYRIDYRIAAGTWSPAATTNASTLTATIEGLTNGTRYAFRVSALTAVATGTTSDAVVSTPFVFGPTATIDSGSSVVGRTLEVGDHVRFHATGLPARSLVTIQLHSMPVTLATVHIPADGVLDADVMIPANAAAGAHTLTLTLSRTGGDPVTTSYAFTVAAVTPAAVTSAVAQQAVASTVASTLAFTGSTGSLAELIGATSMLLTGAFLLIATRIRHRRAERWARY